MMDLDLAYSSRFWLSGGHDQLVVCNIQFQKVQDVMKSWKKNSKKHMDDSPMSFTLNLVTNRAFDGQLGQPSDKPTRVGIYEELVDEWIALNL